MARGFLPLPRSLQDDAEVLLELGLPDELVEGAGPQRPVDLDVFGAGGFREDLVHQASTRSADFTMSSTDASSAGAASLSATRTSPVE